MNQVYLDSARLLTRVAPLVLVDDTFAVKGGTAINLFLRDMPRLSVDLDLVFPDYTVPRAEALKRINEAIRQSVARLKKRGFQTHAPASADAGETKLLVRQGAIQVKIEVNFVMRGTVNPVRMASLTQSARDTLQADLEIPVVSLADVYGGKLVAGMDRQHPRDLFDVMQLFAHEGITAGIRRAFVVYLASVPDYQREYVWTEKEVQQLLQDIDEEFDVGDRHEYFIGTVLVSPTQQKNHFEVIDGQQRLTTFFLLLCAMRQRSLASPNIRCSPAFSPRATRTV